MPTRTTSLIIVALGVVCCAACAVVLAITANGGFAGVAASIAGLALLVGLLLAGAIEGLRDVSRSAAALQRDLDDMHQRVRTIEQRLEFMRANAALSDRARGVLSRSQERLLLVQAAEEDLAAKRFASVQTLARHLQLIGADEDATKLLQQLHAAQRDTLLSPAEPLSPAATNTAIFNAAASTSASPAASAQAQLKVGLEQAFHAAAREGRTDDAMMVLAQLDSLITPEEAVPLREIARDVIAKTRDAMGEKFRTAIGEKRWKDALVLGEQIARQFPNSRMASEVGGMMDALRTRASD